VENEALRALLTGSARYGRSPEAAAHAVRVLGELGVVAVGEGDQSRLLSVVSSERTALERSSAYGAYCKTHQEGQKYLQSRRMEP
jgi:hypothetical protein